MLFFKFLMSGVFQAEECLCIQLVFRSVFMPPRVPPGPLDCDKLILLVLCTCLTSKSLALQCTGIVGGRCVFDGIDIDLYVLSRLSVSCVVSLVF